MSSKVKRRQVIRKAMAGLLSLAMAVTMITPAGSTVYASTLDDEQLTTVETQEEAVPEVEVEVPADDPTEVSEVPEASEVEVSETTEDQAVEVLNPQTLSINDINTIQAVTDMTMYGQGLTEVIITYREGVDVSRVTAANYVLEDRGSLSPDYAKFTIDSVTTEGQTVTLKVSNDTAATANNSIIYTGENAGKRERNALGIYCTGAWYRSIDGQIYYGKEDTAEYKANTLNQGYQARQCLDLRLRHTAEQEWASLVDENGVYDEESLWLPTIDHNFGEGGFITLEEAGINVPSTSASATDGSGDDYVKGWIYVPDNYDELESVPVVFTLQGQGISYWKLPDGTNNFGTGIMYDATATSWIGKGAIVVNIHDRSSNGVNLGDLQGYNYVLDDVNTMKAVLEKYTKIDRDRIILHGNSRGTMASNTVILALTGLPYINNQIAKENQQPLTLDKSVYDFDISVYLCHNGTLGGNYWNEEAREAIARTGLRVWAFDGQQDTNNVDNVAALIADYEKAGVKDYDIRLSGYPTNIYSYWGESDHSTTRINFWYFADEPFHGPDVDVVDGQLVYNNELEPGDTYTLPDGWYGKNAGSSKDGYAYTIYAESFEDWALQEIEPEEIVHTQAITAPGPFGQKLSAVIVEYKDTVDASKLSADTYELRAETNNLTGEYACSTITRVYTNSEPELLPEGADSVPGKYVIIETDKYDKVGLVVDNYYYKTGEDTTASLAIRKDLNDCYVIGIAQKADVVDAAGEVLAPAFEAVIDPDDITFPVLDEFQYLHLNDKEANDVLAGFTFKNNNYEYSISSNTTKSDHQNLTEDDLLGNLNEATLSGLGVNIWYHLPENYDPAKKYPLFVYTHGTGECVTVKAAADGTEINNVGVHFAVNTAASMWAEAADYGYEDVIVIAPQYYSGNQPRKDGYERDDAMRAAFCYALANFAVDRDRVYVTGTSQGAGRTTALLRDCADYITAIVVQNGGYSSYLSKREGGVEMHEKIMKFAASQNVAVWFFQGNDDFISPPVVAETMYTALWNLYKESGKTEAWLQDNLRITHFPKKLYTDMNESSAHSSIKPTYEWYAIYDNDRYYGTYSDAEDSLGKDLDLVYGKNDPDGYKGMMDWVLSKKKSELNEETLQEQVESIDTVTIPNFYGQKVGTVTVTFKDGTDMAAVEKAGVKLYDRGSLNAQFGEVKVSDVKYDGNKAILTIDQGSEKLTDRSRNAFGVYATTGWYIDTAGNIFAGSEDTTDALGMTIHANKTRKGYQARKNLDLILCVGTEIPDGLAMTDGIGNLLRNTAWNTVVNEGYDRIESMMIDVSWKAEGYTMMSDEGYVPIQVIWPEGYDAKRAEKYPVVVYQAGAGLCYWELTDTSVDGVLAPANNPGGNVAFDNMMTGWAEAYPEAIIMSVDVHSADQVVSAKEITGVLDHFIKNYNVDKDRIVGVGNSFGTVILSDVIRQRPDLISAFVENNGRLGNPTDGSTVDGTLEHSAIKHWTAAELQAVLDNQISIWFFNGETDSAHPAVQQDIYTIMQQQYKAAGMSDKWISENLRASGYQSWNFKAWGETDHSCTKITAWYYLTKPYLTPNENGVALKPGDTYRFTGKENANYYGADKFDYKVYAESVSEWVKNVFAGKYADTDEPDVPVTPVYDDVEAFVARLYEKVLGRTPDAKGLAAWVNVLKKGTNGGEEVAKGFIFSDEYIKKNTSNDAFVEMLYNTLLGRNSDAAGKKAWTVQLDKGIANREQIVEGFIHSPEFISICRKTNIFTTAAEAFAARLYTKCLGRDYDKAGLLAWSTLLHSQAIGGGEAAKGFFFSDEFKKMNLDDKEFVSRCYRTFLNREPDAKGLADWMRVLAESKDRESILDGFIGSDEYAKLCVSYGIRR